MSNVNSALSVWQLTIMAVVPVMALTGWLIAIFIAAREPARPEVPAAARPAAPVIAVARGTAGPAAADQDEPAPPAQDRVAA
jgi:hypothetical protein